ncbi:glycosyltransferase family 4 protein [Peribacillus simplex]|uniref:glycosyltransferase family 4 protein n=1 Tax=Peribacillus simplex TaxID=1478 RepID=UPI0036DAC889
MSKIYIIYRSFFDMKGEIYTVGGIQTYIRQLIKVIQERNEVPIVVQFADCNFHKKYNSIDVYGVNVNGLSKERDKAKALINFIEKQICDEDMVVFATEDLFVPTSINKVLAIQHGVGWDIPSQNHFSKRSLFLEVLRKSVGNYIRLKRIRKLQSLVCVDYNFVNWYRSQVFSNNKNIYPIPNCTEVKRNILDKEKDVIKIIFARRFVEFRGTKLFAKVIKKILINYDNVRVTFAGTGPDESYLKEMFKNYSEVNFIKYESENSLEVHEKHHIAIIPTIGSEGTSLSLLEAMASKCAVVATNVGGMTNILIDNYNGLLINPNETELYEAIVKLIINNRLRESISENAYITVSEGFSNEIWEEKWNKVLNQII